MFNRAAIIDAAFTDRVRSGDLPEPQGEWNLPAHILADIFDTQIMSRHLDFMARETKGQTFYSIGSSGHEGLAALAIASRLTDMAFLHYRDAAFCLQRRKAVEGSTPLWDMVLSFSASAEDPVSGGRHKVLGGRDIMAPPQTSTIASHLPKAVGAAHSLCLGQSDQPDDSVILCSFGDASSNHSTAQGAINAACWAAYQCSPMPLVFVCEDNNIGISVPTPHGWVEANFSNRPGLTYMSCDGTDIAAMLATSQRAIEYARARRRPVFLHVKTVRLMGHAGADIEAKYRAMPEVEAVEREDPILKTAGYLLRQQIMGTEDILSAYETMRARVRRAAEMAFTRPKLQIAEEIMAPIAPSQDIVTMSVPSETELVKVGCVEDGRALTLSKILNRTLSEIMARHSNALIFGEDVARKGGVYGVTLDLLKKFGAGRVQDTLLDEQTILGLAIGAAQTGYLPIPEIQFLAYLHNAEDQLRGEAATLSFFSNGDFTNPMVIRIAGLAYQRGFGGHFHNDNGIAVLRDIPGLIVACPSHPSEAAAMLRECTRLAHKERRVVVFLEPIALYNMADIQDSDKAWTSTYKLPHNDTSIRFGEVGQHGDGTDICILTYGNGYYLSRKAVTDARVRIIDIRWLSPLPVDVILEVVQPCKHVLIVDECRKTGSPSEEIITALVEAGVRAPIKRITGHDSFIPLGNAAYEVLPSEADIAQAVEALL